MRARMGCPPWAKDLQAFATCLWKRIGGVEHPRHLGTHSEPCAQTRANAGTCSRRHWQTSDDARRRGRCGGDSGGAREALRPKSHARAFRGGAALPARSAGVCTVASSRLVRDGALFQVRRRDARRHSGDADRWPLGHGRSLSMTVYGVVRRRA